METLRPDHHEMYRARISELQNNREQFLSGQQSNPSGIERPDNPYTLLKPGSKGQAVLNARMKLYELGYFQKKPTQTEYTNNMKDYVKKFEKDNGLKQDGIISPEDQEVLFGL